MNNKFIKMSLASALFALCSLFQSQSQASETFVTHKVTEDETAWFLATVYYGKGSDYTKLLSTNHLKRAEDMKEGMEIRIENPKYSKADQKFSERYAQLWEKRQKALGLHKGEALPNSKVVIPTEKIRNRDNTPKLPFTDGANAGKSAAELAREELLKGSRKSEKSE